MHFNAFFILFMKFVSSRKRCVVSTWGYGCTPGSVNGLSKWGVPEVCGQSSCQTPGADSRRHFPSVFLVYIGPFPFPPPSHCGFSSERAMHPSCCRMCGQTLYLLCQKSHTVPMLDLPLLSLLLPPLPLPVSPTHSMFSAPLHGPRHHFQMIFKRTDG